MSWYCIDLSPEQAEFGFTDIFRAEIEEIFISRGAPLHFTVWLQEAKNGKKIFLSPVAAECAQLLIFRFAGSPCDEPEQSSLNFLLGHAYRDDLEPG